MSRRIGVIVVVLVLLLGVGLLIPAVNRVHQAADRMSCQNHLRQLGIAVLNYYESIRPGAFPMATVASDTLPYEKRLSWLYDVDPFLVARMTPKPAHDRTKAWDAEENRQVVHEDLINYLCPANPNRARPPNLPLTNYVGIAGLGEDARGYRKRTREPAFSATTATRSLKTSRTGRATR